MTIDSIRSRLALALFMTGFICAGSAAEAQRGDLTDAGSYRSTDRGFLFVDGEYVPRPYEFRKEGDSYFVNEINLAAIGIDLSLYVKEAKVRQERRTRKKKSTAAGREPIAKLHSETQFWLYAFDTVLLAPGLPPVCLDGSDEGGDLLRVLADPKKRMAASTSVPDWAPDAPSVDPRRLKEYYSTWVPSFQPSDGFLVDAQARIAFLDSAEIANDQSHAAEVRLATFGYPLTILMMILVVYGFGHLLSHRPNTDEWICDAKSNPLRIPFYRSLMLIAGLSAVDLVWTILVSQAGAMRELNPVGSQIIDDPLQLVGFKVLVTASAVGLLFFCRQAALARQASWWSCLVLTLVAARWLVFNSMFIS